MRTYLTLAFIALLGGTAMAQSDNAPLPLAKSGGTGKFALGVEALFGPVSVGTSGASRGIPTGAMFGYDRGQWRVEAIGAFSHSGPDSTIIDMGGRLLWALHKGTASDFSVGAGFGVSHTDSTDDFHLDIVAQIRAFITPNVALATAGGLGFGFKDTGPNTYGLGGSFVGTAGVAYYFK